MIKRIKNKIKAIWKRFKDGFSFEYTNPLEEWGYAKDWFKIPNIRFKIIKPHMKKSPMNAWAIEFYSSNMAWKNKYGMLEFEDEPYIELTLFNKVTFQITFEAPDVTNGEPYAYWEGILYVMSCYDCNTNIKKFCDEKIMWLTYINNKFGQFNKEDKIDYKYTILPYLNHRGFFLWNKAKGIYGSNAQVQP